MTTMLRSDKEGEDERPWERGCKKAIARKSKNSPTPSLTRF